MGTYIYSGLHPRKGTVPVHTFFPCFGGKPVVAMKSSIIIEGQCLQRIKLKDVQATMNAYEQFLISTIYETSQEYDYALLVENLDNESVPDKVVNCSSKPGDSFIGIIIDFSLLDETYTVGCGPQVFTNVISDFAHINTQSEFLCVQIQRSSDSCIWDDNICNGEAEIKKLLDPTAAIIPQELTPSPHHSTKHKKGHVITSHAAMSQAQNSPTKSNKLVPSTTSSNSLSKMSPLPQTQKKPTQGRKLKSSSSSNLQSHKSSVPEALHKAHKNPRKTAPFKPFAGWCSSVSNASSIPEAQSNLLETCGDSSSSCSYESFEELWDISDPDEPFQRSAYSSILECIRAQGQGSTTESSNMKPSTNSASSLSYMSLYPRAQTSSTKNSNHMPSANLLSYKSLCAQTQCNSTKSNNLKPLTNSASSLSYDSPEEDSEDISDPSDSLGNLASSSFFKTICAQAKKSTTKSSRLASPTSSGRPLKYESLEEESWGTPEPFENLLSNTAKSSHCAPSTNSGSSWFLRSLYPEVETNSTKSNNLTPSSSANSSFLKSLYPDIETNSTKNSNLNPLTSSACSSTSKCLNLQAPSNFTKSSQVTPSTSSTCSSWYETVYPRAATSHLSPLTNSPSSLRYESLTPQVQSSSASSWYESLTPLGHRSHLTPSTTMVTSLRPTVPGTENETAIQAANNVCSQVSLEDFEALKPTLSSHEKRNKAVEDFMTVTI